MDLDIIRNNWGLNFENPRKIVKVIDSVKYLLNVGTLAAVSFLYYCALQRLLFSISL